VFWVPDDAQDPSAPAGVPGTGGGTPAAGEAPPTLPMSGPPMSGPPSSGPPSSGPPSSGPPQYPGPPGYGQPGYDQAGYGQPAGPGQPVYGQGHQLGQPGYGQEATPGQPPGQWYSPGQPYPPGHPGYGPGYPPGQPAYSQAPYGYAYGGPAKAGRVNGYAIASLVLGLAGFMLVTLVLSVIFGIVALVGIRKTAERGKGLAIAGLAASGVWLLLFVIIVIGAASSPNSSSATGHISHTVTAGVHPHSG
jgi:Domain of unknown function (DUF4190)